MSRHHVLSMALTVPAGKELHQCQFVQVPAGADLEVVRIGHQYTPGSHHFLLYETGLTAIPPEFTGQYDCTVGDEPIMEHTRGILYAGQSPKGEFPLPPGVALTIKAGTVVMFQSHYINAGKSDLLAKVDLTLDTAPPETIKEKAGFLLFYDPFIHLPAKGKAQSGVRCPIPNDIKLLNGFTHYHQRGTGMKVFVDPNGQAPSTTPFYETHDWEHPQDHVGPTPIAAGSTVRFACAYDNTTSETEIFQGPNAQTSEMCVFAGLYYPKMPDSDYENCGHVSIVGEGTKACTDVASCIQACPAGDAPKRTWSGVKVGACWERCVASGCDKAVDTFLPLATCLSTKCKEECSTGYCLGCITEKCGNEYETCSTHVCQ